jgi:hypothetical protein
MDGQLDQLDQSTTSTTRREHEQPHVRDRQHRQHRQHEPAALLKQDRGQDMPQARKFGPKPPLVLSVLLLELDRQSVDRVTHSTTPTKF